MAAPRPPHDDAPSGREADARRDTTTRADAQTRPDAQTRREAQARRETQGHRDAHFRRDAQARRDISCYSRLVRGLKIILPLVALALLSGLFLIPRDDTLDGGLVYSTADLLALGEGLSVSNPRIEGATAAGEPYAVEADRATPDGPNPTLVELDGVRADFSQADGRQVQVQAQEGALRPRDQTLSLDGDVVLTTSDGYRVTTQSVQADLRAGTAVAPGALRAVGPDGSIEAGSFRALHIRAPEDRVAPPEGFVPGYLIGGGDGDDAGDETGDEAAGREAAQAAPAAADDGADAPAADALEADAGAEAGSEVGSEALGSDQPGDYLWFENGVRVVWKPAKAEK